MRKRWMVWLMMFMLTMVVYGQQEKRIITVDLENVAVKAFVDEVEYTTDSPSVVGNYLPADCNEVRYDLPKPVVVDVPLFNVDSVFVTYRDTVVTHSIDTLITTTTDTLCNVTYHGTQYEHVDTLIAVTTDTIYTHHTTTTIAIVHDTLTVVPEDTFRLCYSLKDDYTQGDTLYINNGVREAVIYNLVPQQVYYYKIEVNDSLLVEGEIHTTGRVRMIYAPSILNVRDIGGWTTTDNKRILYGKIFRGGELNGVHTADSIDIKRLFDLGIKAELDLRAWYDEGNNTSAFGFHSDSTYLYTNSSGQLPEHMTSYRYLNNWKKEFNFILNNLKKNYTVYQHCVWGRDRTGYLSILLEGLLGVSYSDLMKEYELTCFAYKSANDKKADIDSVLSYIDGLSGETLKEKFNYFFVNKIGVSQDDINVFRSIMLEDLENDDDDNVEIVTDINTTNAYSNSTHDLDIYDLNGNRISNNAKKKIIIYKENDGIYRKVVKN